MLFDIPLHIAIALNCIHMPLKTFLFSTRKMRVLPRCAEHSVLNTVFLFYEKTKNSSMQQTRAVIRTRYEYPTKIYNLYNNKLGNNWNYVSVLLCHILKHLHSFFL